MTEIFVVDAMLGKVALWLRLTGHDAVYSPEIDIHDNEILELAKGEGRVILTSDEELHQRAIDQGTKTMLVRETVADGIARVFLKFKIEPRISPATSRCTKCGGTLEQIDSSEKERIKDLVYEQTYDHYDVFWFCTSCNSVFWEGSHWMNMTEYLKRIRLLMDRLTKQDTT